MDENKPSSSEPQVIRLSDLSPKRQKFEYGGTEYEIRNTAELSIPEIAKVDRMAKELQEDLRLVSAGKYAPPDGDDPEGVNIEGLEKRIREFTRMITIDVPEDVVVKMTWVEHFVLMGTWQRSQGNDFLLAQLAKVLPSSPTPRRAQYERKRNRT